MQNLIKKIVEAVSDGILQQISEKMDSIKSSSNVGAEPEVFSISDVCESLKISKPTLSRHIKQGYLSPSFYVGRSPRFTRSAIENYINNFNKN